MNDRGSFQSIEGITGYYKSEIELVLQGSPEALDAARAYLTVTNYPVIDELRRLRKTKPRTPKHAWFVKKKIEELIGKEEIKLYADIPDGLSVPPGFHFLCTNKPGAAHAKMEPKWVGIERYYQKEAVGALLKVDRGCLHAATAVGKSLIIRTLCRTFTSMGKRVLVIVPSVELLKQTFFPLVNDKTFTVSMLGDGNKPSLGCQVLVSTAQSAIQEVDKYNVVLFDEGHHASASTWQELCVSAVNAEKMYALTASPFRADKMDDLIWSFCGPIVYRYLPSQAIADGYICPIDYHQVFVPMHSVYINSNTSHIKEYIQLHSHPEYVARVKDIVQKSLAKGKKTLVLYKSIECCKALARELGVESADGEYRKPFYDFKNGKTDLCIANINLLGEGIDVPAIESLIYCAGTASTISAIQAFGRAVRLSPGKQRAVVVDVIPDKHKWRSFAAIRKDIAEEYRSVTV